MNMLQSHSAQLGNMLVFRMHAGSDGLKSRTCVVVQCWLHTVMCKVRTVENVSL